MVEITGEYEGDLRVVARHGPSGEVMRTDAPTDNEGKGEAFSPTDLVGTAMATCMLTIMGIAARRRGWPLEGSTFRVSKQMVADPLRRIARLDLEFHLPAVLGPEARAALEEAALTCPVHRSLHPDVEVPIAFHYDR